MKLRLLLVLLTMVLAPLAGLAWLGLQVTRQDEARREQQVRELLEQRLAAFDARLARQVASWEQTLLSLSKPMPPQAPAAQTARPALSTAPRLSDDELAYWRSRSRRHPLIAQLFLLSPQGHMLFPPALEPQRMNRPEREFLGRTRTIWLGGTVGGHEFQADALVQSESAALPQALQTVAPAPSKQSGTLDARDDYRRHATAMASRAGFSTVVWQPFFHDIGLRLIAWQREANGWTIGAELNRSRMLMEIIAALPETGAEAAAGERIVLVDEHGRALYQWGAHVPESDQTPLAVHALSFPLSAWSLRYHMSDTAYRRMVGNESRLGAGAGLVALALALVGLSVYFYREHSRAMREAATRVSFVNQVSHELKSPLTNIRMYAELLQDRIPSDDQTAGRHLGVIVTESQRLSRLIDNVLAFARHQRGRLRLQPRPVALDDLVQSLVERFRVTLAPKGFELDAALAAPEPVRCDPDAVEQILGNLVSNVEKYAASGRWLGIRTDQDDRSTRIRVCDRGPGIAPRDRQRIFEPFTRLSDALTEGVSGAGIGLAIARELARQHGGDLTLESAEAGACFVLELPAERKQP